MKNLAGAKDCDKDIQKELTKAQAEIKEVSDNTSEVPYTLMGIVGNWELRRLWYYWSARPIKGKSHGLPLDVALKLHNKKYPSEMFEDCDIENYGSVIRAGGDAGATSPDIGYASQPINNAEFITECRALGVKIISQKSIGWGTDETEYPELNYGQISDLCNEGKIKAKRYVDCYHIDSQEGLNEFVRTIKELENSNNNNKY
jgi:hypothetical protein